MPVAAGQDPLCFQVSVAVVHLFHCGECDIQERLEGISLHLAQGLTWTQG